MHFPVHIFLIQWHFVEWFGRHSVTKFQLLNRQGNLHGYHLKFFNRVSAQRQISVISLILLHSERPKLHTILAFLYAVLAFLSAIGLNCC